MYDSSLSRAVLQRRIDRLSTARAPLAADYAPTGQHDIDAMLGGGLLRARLHEIVAIGPEDAASAAGFAAMCARRIGGRMGWLRLDRHDRALNAGGLREIGIDPDRLLLVTAPDPVALLRAAAEALGCAALGAVVIELWGDAQRDITTSRRLVLGAEASGVTALLLRIAVQPAPSAAQTRWAVRAAPSAPLAANAPGAPALELELLRQRGGPAGMRWHVEWDRDGACLRAPLSGAVAAVPVGRSLADGTGARRYASG